MIALLVANCILLGLSGTLMTVAFIGWLRADKKLAKYGESKFYKE